jgi:hypothetical protein
MPIPVFYSNRHLALAIHGNRDEIDRNADRYLGILKRFVAEKIAPMGGAAPIQPDHSRGNAIEMIENRTFSL